LDQGEEPDATRDEQGDGWDVMTSSKAKRISKISADIARIEKSFFRSDDPDLRQRYYELQRKREHLLRSIILELHLSIENIITGAIGNELLQGRLIRSPAGHAIRDLLEDDHALGFRHKLLLARSLNLITRAEFTDLAELNTVRNRCSHNWQLNKVTRRKLTPSKAKKPILRFRGTNLYQTDAFLKFVGLFSKHYLKLFLRLA